MFIEKLLQLMAEKKASDIFFSVGSPIMIKIQGNIMPVNPQVMDAETVKKIIYEFLTPAHIATFEKDLELNLSKPMPGIGNFRVNVFWQKGSVACVIRYVTAEIPKLEDLNLPPVLLQLVMEKRGLVLVVGATGSGKSTTLASMLDYRNQMAANHILTIEDPVEYVFTPKKCIFNQREVGNDTHAFHDALRNAMRQAPDCILIGEIRDQETMRMALTYALSGHLCLATLHANNSYQAMNRVISFFPLEVRPMLLQDLSVSLRAIVSQRLVKTRRRQAHARRRGAAQLPQRRGGHREGRGGRGEGDDGEEHVARLADLRAGPLPAGAPGQDLHRRGARQRRLRHEPGPPAGQLRDHAGHGGAGEEPGGAQPGQFPGRPVVPGVQDLGGALRPALQLTPAA